MFDTQPPSNIGLMATPTTITDRSAPNQGRALTILMTAAGVSSTWLAEELGASTGAVSNWVNNRSAMTKLVRRAAGKALGEQMGDNRGDVPEDMFTSPEEEVWTYLAARFSRDRFRPGNQADLLVAV